MCLTLGLNAYEQEVFSPHTVTYTFNETINTFMLHIVPGPPPIKLTIPQVLDIMASNHKRIADLHKEIDMLNNTIINTCNSAKPATWPLFVNGLENLLVGHGIAFGVLFVKKICGLIYGNVYFVRYTVIKIISLPIIFHILNSDEFKTFMVNSDSYIVGAIGGMASGSWGSMVPVPA